MKKVGLILSILLLAVISCRKEDISYVGQGGSMSEVSESDVICRPSAGVKTSLNSAMQVMWDRQDKIRILSAETPKGSSYHIKELSADQRTAVFSTDSIPVAGQVRYAVYPESSFKSFDMSEGVVRLKAPEAYDIPYLTMVASSEGSLFEFSNLFGALRVRPYDIQGIGLSIKGLKVVSKDGKPIGGDVVIDVKTMAISCFEGEKDYVEASFSEPIDICSNGWTSWSTHNSAAFKAPSEELLIYVPCGEYPRGFDVVLIDNHQREYTFETGPISVIPGVTTPLPYTPLTVYYGAENSVRVALGAKTVEVDITPYYTFSRRFQREGRVVKSGNAIVSSAEVIWQQEYDCRAEDIMATSGSGKVVSGTSPLEINPAEGGRFSLAVPLTGTAGNALIAIKDASGTILWSFHIWVSDAADISCNTLAGGEYVIMDRNLGATSADNFSQTTEELVRNSFGLFYQWGRKDPFPRVLHRTARVGSPYSADLPFTNSVLRHDRTTGSIGYSIRNPHHRIHLINESGCNWLISYVGELWGFHYSAADVDLLVAENQIKEGVKTVYDPCPAGYRIADIKHIKGLLDQNKDKLTASRRNAYYGFLFETGTEAVTYFPASGWVKSSMTDDEALFHEGFWGMLWTSASNVSNAYYMHQNADSASFQTIVRGHMCPVRCVKIKP